MEPRNPNLDPRHWTAEYPEDRQGVHERRLREAERKIMKINDLPSDLPLAGTVFLHPETGERCVWQSQWEKGVWFTKPGDNSHRVYPLALNDISEAFEFELAENHE